MFLEPLTRWLCPPDPPCLAAGPREQVVRDELSVDQLSVDESS